MPEPDSDYLEGRPHRASSRPVVRYTGYREFSTGPPRRREAPHGTVTLILELILELGPRSGCSGQPGRAGRGRSSPACTTRRCSPSSPARSEVDEMDTIVLVVVLISTAAGMVGLIRRSAASRTTEPEDARGEARSGS